MNNQTIETGNSWTGIAMDLAIGALIAAAGMFAGLEGWRLIGFFTAVNLAITLSDIKTNSLKNED